MKLNEFRLESYDERSALQMALCLFKTREGPDGFYAEAISALEKRVSQTECQPGGCEYCRPDLNHRTWEDDE